MRNKSYLFLAIALALSACALTPITLASSAINGLSYFATGKTATDHALSLFMRRDCSMIRVMSQAEICYGAPAALIAFSFDGAEPRPRTFGEWEYEGMEWVTDSGWQVPPANARRGARLIPQAGRLVLPEDHDPVWEFAGMPRSDLLAEKSADPIAVGARSPAGL